MGRSDSREVKRSRRESDRKDSTRKDSTRKESRRKSSPPSKKTSNRRDTSGRRNASSPAVKRKSERRSSEVPRRGSAADGEGHDILVRGFPPSVDEPTLEKIFKQYGEIISSSIPIDYYSKKPKRFGFLKFANEDDAEEAVRKMDQATVDGSVLTCARAKGQKKTSGFMAKLNDERGPPPHIAKRLAEEKAWKDQQREESRKGRRGGGRGDSRGRGRGGGGGRRGESGRGRERSGRGRGGRDVRDERSRGRRR